MTSRCAAAWPWPEPAAGGVGAGFTTLAVAVPPRSLKCTDANTDADTENANCKEARRDLTSAAGSHSNLWPCLHKAVQFAAVRSKTLM